MVAPLLNLWGVLSWIWFYYCAYQKSGKKAIMAISWGGLFAVIFAFKGLSFGFPKEQKEILRTDAFNVAHLWQIIGLATPLFFMPKEKQA
jgi:hypothetical protein